MRKVALVPVYNEETTVLGVLEGLSSFSIDFYIIIADGPTDNSRLIIESWMKGKENVFFYPLDRNHGKGYAVKIGLMLCQELLSHNRILPTDVLIFIDADGQHQINDIPKMTEVFQSGDYDLLIAKRDLSLYPAHKRFGNKILSKTASWVSAYRFMDIESGFRIMKISIVNTVLKYFEGSRYSDSQEIGIIAAWLKFKIHNTFPSKIQHYRKRGTKTKDLWFNALAIARLLYRLAFDKSQKEILPLREFEQIEAISKRISKIGRADKILLINPPSKIHIKEARCQIPLKGMIVSFSRPPIDLAYYAAVLENNGFECMICDAPIEKYSWHQISKMYKYLRLEAVIFNVSLFSLDSDMKICEIFQENTAKIISKGTFTSEQALEIIKKYAQLDILIYKDSHSTMQSICNKDELSKIPNIAYRKDGACFLNPDADPIDAEHETPFPARYLLKNELYRRPGTNQTQTTIDVGRGCGGKCIFCTVNIAFGKKIFIRSIDNVIKEIKECTDRFQIDNFFFRSDNFTGSRDWVVSFCQKIIDEKLGIQWISNSRVDAIDEDLICLMKKSGCWGLALGVESGDQVILEKIKKGTTLAAAQKAVELCRNADIVTVLYFILGLPWDSEKTIKESVKFAKSLNADLAEFNIAVPFPGTEFYKIAKEKKLFNTDAYENLDFTNFKINTFFLNSTQLHSLRKKSYMIYYFRLAYLLKILKKAGSTSNLLNTIKFASYKIFYLIVN